MADETIDRPQAEDIDTMPKTEAPNSVEQGGVPQHKRHTAARVMAVVGMIATVAAWLLFMGYPDAAAVVAAVGVVCSAVGIGVGRGCMRNLAITALIAAVILVIVYGAFAWLIPHIVHSL